MIVPFSDIPSAFLTPLSVETDARYTLDMKKFPGLSSGGCKEPALIPAPLKTITSTTDHGRESCSGQLCLPSTSRAATPVTSDGLYRHQQSTSSIFSAQRELYQLLDSYQVEYPEVSAIVANSAVADRRPILTEGNYMEGIPGSVNHTGEMCVLSPRKMLSTFCKVESSNLSSCHRTGKFASCVRLNQSKAYLSNGGLSSCSYQNGSLPDGDCPNETFQSCACSLGNNISDCGVRQRVMFSQPLLDPVFSSCRLSAFPTPDYMVENSGQFDTNHRFIKRSCSFSHRAVPYTSRRNVNVRQTSHADFSLTRPTPQYISPVMNGSHLSLNHFPLVSGTVTYNQCLRV